MILIPRHLDRVTCFAHALDNFDNLANAALLFGTGV